MFGIRALHYDVRIGDNDCAGWPSDSKERCLAFLISLKTLINAYSIDRHTESRIFALWFFHNSIRFKVNKVG